MEKMYFDRGNNYKDMGKYESALVVNCLTITNNYNATTTSKSNDMIFALLDQFKYVNDFPVNQVTSWPLRFLVASPRFHFIYLVGRVRYRYRYR